jgi:hypothetical protein
LVYVPPSVASPHRRRRCCCPVQVHRDLGMLISGGDDGVVRWWSVREVDQADSTDAHPIPGLLPLAELHLPRGTVVRSIVRLSNDGRGAPLTVTAPVALAHSSSGATTARSQSGLAHATSGEAIDAPAAAASARHDASQSHLPDTPSAAALPEPVALSPSPSSGDVAAVAAAGVPHASSQLTDDELIAGAPYVHALNASIEAAWGHGATHSQMVSSARTLDVGPGGATKRRPSQSNVLDASGASQAKLPHGAAGGLSRRPSLSQAGAGSQLHHVASAASTTAGGGSNSGRHHQPHLLPPIVRRVTWLIADASGKVWRAETLAFAAMHRRRGGAVVAVPGVRLLEVSCRVRPR